MDPEDAPISHLLPLTKGNLRAPEAINDPDEIALGLDSLALSEEAYRKIVRVHNAWMGHRGGRSDA